MNQYAQLKSGDKIVRADNKKYDRRGGEIGNLPKGQFSVFEYECWQYVADKIITAKSALEAAKQYWREHVGGRYGISKFITNGGKK